MCVAGMNIYNFNIASSDTKLWMNDEQTMRALTAKQHESIEPDERDTRVSFDVQSKNVCVNEH